MREFSRLQGLEDGLSLPISSVALREPPFCEALEPARSAVNLLKKVSLVPIVGTDKRLYGAVDSHDVIEFLMGGSRFADIQGHPHILDIPIERLMGPARALPPDRTLFEALGAFWRSGTHTLFIADDGKLSGQITLQDLLPRLPLPDSPVSYAMTRNPLFLSDSLPVRDAAKILLHAGFRRYPVARENIALGILTGQDILKHGLEGRVADAMTRKLVTVRPGDSLAKAAKLLAAHQFGALPVIEEDALVGLISATDVAEAALRHGGHPAVRGPPTPSSHEAWPEPERRRVRP